MGNFRSTISAISPEPSSSTNSESEPVTSSSYINQENGKSCHSRSESADVFDHQQLLTPCRLATAYESLSQSSCQRSTNTDFSSRRPVRHGNDAADDSIRRVYVSCQFKITKRIAK